MFTSTVALLKWWLRTVDSVTPDQVASIYLDVIMHAAAKAALEPREEWLKGYA